MRLVSKRVIQTLNSNGSPKTMINITNQSDNKIIKTKAVTDKNKPTDFRVVQQGVEKEGSKVVSFQKFYMMNEKDIMSLFKNAEVVGTNNLKSYGAKEVKLSDDGKIVMKKESKKKLSKKEDKDKKMKKEKKLKDKLKTIKKSLSEKKIKKSKLKRGGSDSIIAFDKEDKMYAPFQTVEQEKSLNNIKGGSNSKKL